MCLPWPLMILRLHSYGWIHIGSLSLEKMHGHNHCESVICTLHLWYDMTMQLIVACVQFIVVYEFAQKISVWVGISHPFLSTFEAPCHIVVY